MATNNTQKTSTVGAIITILLLITVYPLGVLVMWFATQWPKALKIVLSVLIIPWLFIAPIVLSVVLIGINPTKQFAEANNTKRTADIKEIANAILQYQKDNNQTPHSQVQEMSSGDFNICSSLVPKYLSALPEDPSINAGQNISDCSQAYDTGYTVVGDGHGGITVSAPHAENGATISISE